jgi:hypothetical protein
MAVSFIVSSGAVKTVGQVILHAGCRLFWMPAATGAVFFLPLVLSVFCLESFPEPTEDDVTARTERIQMNSQSRLQFFKDFGPALILMTLFYTLLSAYRDFRDNFAAELWEAFGESGTPSVFTTSEIIVAIIIVIPIGLFMMIKEYMTTLIAYHVLIACGLVMTLICTIVLDRKGVPGLPYMVATGVGLYMGYVPFNSIIFDLILAAFSYKANAGFMMYICDACGYTAAVVILFVKNFGSKHVGWLEFYIKFGYVVTVVGTVLIIGELLFLIFAKSKRGVGSTNSEKIDEKGETEMPNSDKPEEEMVAV